MPRISHHVITTPIRAEMPISHAPRNRMLRWLATMKGSMLRFGCDSVSTPISVERSAGSKIGAATCMTVFVLSPGTSALERAPYSPRRVR